MSAVQNNYEAFTYNINNAYLSGGKGDFTLTFEFSPEELGIDPRKAPKTKTVTDEQIEKKLFAHFKLDINDAKKRLKTDDPFEKVNTSGDNQLIYNEKTGKYQIKVSVDRSLYNQLDGRAKEIKQQITDENAQTKPQNSTNPNETNAGKNGIDNTRRDQEKLRRLAEQAQVLTTAFGEPTKLTDLKHYTVKQISVSGYSAEDNALASMIEEKYGSSNLWGDKKAEILQIAKSAGVKVENLKPNENGTVGFDLTVESLLKLQHAYIGVQEKFNIDKAAAAEAIANHPIQKFAQGVVDGAWEDLKQNWKMVTSPWQTIKEVASGAWELGKLGARLAAMPEMQRNALFAQLAKAGVENLANMPVSEAAYKLGKLVGMAAVELVLMKGVGAVAGTGLKALKAISGSEFGKTLLTSAVNIAKDVKQTVGNIPVPTGIKAVEILTTTGESLKFPTLQSMKLGEITKPLFSQAKQIFSSGGKLIDEAVVLAAKEKAANLVKAGDAQQLKTFLKDSYQKYGYQLYDELKTTVAKTIEDTYGVRKTVDLDEMLGGHTLEKHVGKSDDWLRNRLLNDAGAEAASTFRNKEVADRTIAKFVKENKSEIEAWLKDSSENQFQRNVEMNEIIGNVLKRGKGYAPNSKSVQTSKATVYIVRDAYSTQGWRVETAFPIPR